MNDQSNTPAPSTPEPTYVRKPGERVGDDPDVMCKVWTKLPSGTVPRGYYVNRYDPEYVVYVEGYIARLDLVTVQLSTPGKETHAIQTMTSGIFHTLFTPSKRLR